MGSWERLRIFKLLPYYKCFNGPDNFKPDYSAWCSSFYRQKIGDKSKICSWALPDKIAQFLLSVSYLPAIKIICFLV